MSLHQCLKVQGQELKHCRRDIVCDLVDHNVQNCNNPEWISSRKISGCRFPLSAWSCNQYICRYIFIFLLVVILLLLLLFPIELTWRAPLLRHWSFSPNSRFRSRWVELLWTYLWGKCASLDNLVEAVLASVKQQVPSNARIIWWMSKG
jgi:hypothetical protein